MVSITLHKKGTEQAKHIVDEMSYLAYVEVNNSDTNQNPTHQAVQIGSTTTINYLPNGWVIIDGNHIHIQAHDGKGNNVTEVATINLVRKEVI